jgi:hypothetical protein
MKAASTVMNTIVSRVCPDGKEGHAFQIAMDTSLNVLGKTVKGR